MIITMRTEVPLVNNMTVGDLIKVLEAIPDKRAKISAQSYGGGGYGSSTTYRLLFNWTQELGDDTN